MIRTAILLCLVFFVTNEAVSQRISTSKPKLSLNAYSFNNLLRDNLKSPTKGMSLFDLLNFCAKNNFDAVDLTGYYFPGYPKPPSDSFLFAMKKRAFELGLEISGTGVRNDFGSADADKRAADVQHVKTWIDVAAKLGAPVVRIFSGNIPKGFENKWDSVADYMASEIRQCADHGKQKGVLIGIQNHDDFLKTSEQTLKLLRLINHDWVGVVVDIGSFPTANPYEDVRRVMPHAVNFQFKEYIKTSAGPRKTEIAKVLEVVKSSGYRGYLPIETLPDPVNKSKKYEPLKSVPLFLNQIRTEVRKVYRRRY